MARVLLLHYREARTGRQLAQALKAEGHQVYEAVPEHPEVASSLEVAKPEVLVVEASYRWNKGLEAAGLITDKEGYRGLPVLLVDLPEAAEGFKRMKVPEGRAIEAEAIVPAVAEAAGSPSPSRE